MKILQKFGHRESAYERPTQKWVCGRMAAGLPCRVGPDGKGRCQADFECVPTKQGDSWLCRRPESAGGACEAGPSPDGTCCRAIPRCTPTLSLAARRARVVRWSVAFAVGFVALVMVGEVFGLRLSSVAGGLLSPGPLTASHDTLTNCAACHTNVPAGKFAWLHTVFAKVSPDETSGACLNCHEMEQKTALNPHGATNALLDELRNRTEQLEQTASAAAVPISMQLRNAVFPERNSGNSTIFCASCHQEHQGEGRDLTDVSNAQCQSCHAVQFASFQSGHPDIGTYPFKRRTRLIFDHDSHFLQHFPDEEKKAPARQTIFGEKIDQPINADGTLASRKGQCSNCHVPGPDKSYMIVKPFEQVCASCHLDQITQEGLKDNAIKAVPVFNLPGLDLETLREVKAPIGEWPEKLNSFGEEPSGEKLSPLLLLLLGADHDGRQLLARLAKNPNWKPGDAFRLRDLDDLSDLHDRDESDQEKVTKNRDQMKAVVELVWKIKKLLYALSTKNITDSTLVKTFTAELGRDGDNDPLLKQLTGRIPRDVWLSAKRAWLPNLDEEIANNPDAGIAGWRLDELMPMPEPQEPDTDNTGEEPDTSSPTDPASSENNDIIDVTDEDGDKDPLAEEDPSDTDSDENILDDQSAETPGEDPLAEDGDGADNAEILDETGTDGTDSADADILNGDEADDTDILGEDGTDSADADILNGDGADDADILGEDGTDSTDAEILAGNENDDGEILGEDGTDSTDGDILAGNETDDADILGENGTDSTDGDILGGDGETPSNEIETSAETETETQTETETATETESVEPEEQVATAAEWAEFGGWYRQNYQIQYRPIGHADSFMQAWITFSGYLTMGKTYDSLARPVFDMLRKDSAPGQCGSCHSVDKRAEKGLRMNWVPFSPDDTAGSFTRFSHEPHFSIIDDKGCQTCHVGQKNSGYADSFKPDNNPDHDPLVFSSNFKPVDQQYCMNCHNETKAGQDCQLCHVYHVTDVETRSMASTTDNEWHGR